MQPGTTASDLEHPPVATVRASDVRGFRLIDAGSHRVFENEHETFRRRLRTAIAPLRDIVDSTAREIRNREPGPSAINRFCSFHATSPISPSRPAISRARRMTPAAEFESLSIGYDPELQISHMPASAPSSALTPRRGRNMSALNTIEQPMATTMTHTIQSRSRSSRSLDEAFGGGEMIEQRPGAERRSTRARRATPRRTRQCEPTAPTTISGRYGPIASATIGSAGIR